VSLHNRPPLAADACGSLLTIAEQLLALENPRVARERLNPLFLAQVSMQPSMWMQHFLRDEARCSAGLRTAVAGRHKRQVASVLVWARVTQSEPRLAPLILADTQAPGHRSELAESVAQACYQSRRPGRYGEHWFVLKETLDAYADQLAARIDAG
jgi:hypothetical protein